jgi:hypothetical protein
MTREIALHCMKSASELERELCEECPIYGQTGCDHCFEDALQYVIGMLEQEPTIKALGEELRKARKGIADEKVLIGYNMAIAICNKHLGESEGV